MIGGTLNRALGYQEALRDLVIHRPGGWADAAALAEATALCRSALATVPDGACRTRIIQIEHLLGDLYSDAGHLKWERTPTSGRDFLRLMVLHELTNIEDRLNLLQRSGYRPDPEATLPVEPPTS